MQVFKLYFKVLRSNIRFIIMYAVMFACVFIAFTLYYRQDVSKESYETAKVEIAIIDHDQSQLSKELTTYLESKTKVVSVLQDEQAIKDALFYDQILCAVTIPHGFEEAFLQGTAQLDTQMKPDSMNGYLIENYITSYLNTTHMYVERSVAIADAIQLAKDDLNQHANVSIYEHTQMLDDETLFDRKLHNIFFNYLTYMFLAIVILTVGLIMKEFNKREVRMRNIASPLQQSSYNLQLILGNLCYCSAIWLLFMLIICVISPSILSDPAGFLYMFNAYIFILICLGLGYLISVLFSNVKHAEDALNGVANIISLGSSFLCGAFVPQALISKGVLMAASFTPAYWYIRFNDELNEIGDFTWLSVSHLFQYMGIEVLFGVTFVILALVISKSKRSQQEL